MTVNTNINTIIIVVGIEREANVLTLWVSNPGRNKICFLLLIVLIVCEGHSVSYSMGNVVISWG